LVNPLTPDQWVQSLKKANLNVQEHIPILPKWNSGFFLMMDNLWHIKNKKDGEMGDEIFPFLSSYSNFPKGFRKIFSGLLDIECDWEDCSGAVFIASKD
jgi:hypothetical protein